jgi:hypothetical protein
MKFIPETPRESLLDGVVDCGMIPADVVIEYFESDGSGSENPMERYGSQYKMVPEEIREQARGVWLERLQAELNAQIIEEQPKKEG